MKGAVLYKAKVYHIFGSSKRNIYEDASTRAHQLDSTQLLGSSRHLRSQTTEFQSRATFCTSGNRRELWLNAWIR